MAARNDGPATNTKPLRPRLGRKEPPLAGSARSVALSLGVGLALVLGTVLAAWGLLGPGGGDVARVDAALGLYQAQITTTATITPTATATPRPTPAAFTIILPPNTILDVVCARGFVNAIDREGERLSAWCTGTILPTDTPTPEPPATAPPAVTVIVVTATAEPTGTATEVPPPTETPTPDLPATVEAGVAGTQTARAPRPRSHLPVLLKPRAR